MKGPGPILIDNGITLQSAVDPQVAAILDGDHQIEVNGGFYFVASAEEKARFLAAPHQFTGPLKDTAKGGWFTPTATSKVTREGGVLTITPESHGG